MNIMSDFEEILPDDSVSNPPSFSQFSEQHALPPIVSEHYISAGNVMQEADLADGLKEIMEYHMSKLQRKLDIFASLAKVEEKEEEKDKKYEE
jgi:hypothetical protein